MFYIFYSMPDSGPDRRRNAPCRLENDLGTAEAVRGVTTACLLPLFGALPQLLISPQEYETLLKALKERIRSAQLQALRSVNSELISLYTDIWPHDR
jgi:hypothetical protein